MTDYRVLKIGLDGHVEASRAFVCDSDEHAIEWAKQLQEDRPVELWSGERLVKRLSTSVAKQRRAISHEIHGGRMLPKKET
jgi:hypothetical protein